MLNAIERCFPDIISGKYTESQVYGNPRIVSTVRRKSRKGGLFLCPICMKRHQTFLPFGLSGRRNARCPECGSLERHRFLYLYIRDVMRWTRKRLRILHIAPEPCIRKCLAPLPHIDYKDIDLFTPDVKQKMNITELTFPDKYFDGIICCHVLEHVVDDSGALLQLKRVLKKNGSALIMIPQDLELKITDEDFRIRNPSERYLRFGHPYHVRTCGSDYANRFNAAGFVVNKIDSSRLSRQRRRLHRLNKSIIYRCGKP